MRSTGVEDTEIKAEDNVRTPAAVGHDSDVISMRLGRVARHLRCGVAALLTLSGTAVNAADTYPRMAPKAAYMMDRAQEIALAKSAAPASLSKDATILVLTPTGYETARKGTNGFVCLVERSFAGAPDWSERWNPKVRAAGCLNPQAVTSILPIDVLRTEMVLAGKSDTEIWDKIKAKLREGEIPALESGAMCYMMSKDAYLTDFGAHGMAHVMFYMPFKSGTEWGANLAGSPVMGGNYWFFLPEHAKDAAALPPISVLLVGTMTWSDGSAASMPPM